MPTDNRLRRQPTHLRIAQLSLLALIIGGCAAAGGAAGGSPSQPPPSGSPGASSPAVVDPAPSGTPGAPPASDDPGAIDPGGVLVVPRPGQLDVQAIPADSFSASVEGRRVVLTITFTSGVEPCSVLDTIIVQRGEGAFAITLRVGRGPGDNVCIMIAEIKKTVVDLGELEPGTYTITDTLGGAPPITVIVA